MNNLRFNEESTDTGKNKKRFSNLTSLAILVSIIAAVIGVGIFVFSKSSTNVAASTTAEPASQDSKKYVATRKITVDRETGELRKPTDQELQELVESLKTMTRRPEKGLQRSALRGGGQAVNLEGGFAGVMLARPNADGTSELRCVFTFEEGAAFLGLEAVNSEN